MKKKSEEEVKQIAIAGVEMAKNAWHVRTKRACEESDAVDKEAIARISAVIIEYMLNAE